MPDAERVSAYLAQTPKARETKAGREYFADYTLLDYPGADGQPRTGLARIVAVGIDDAADGLSMGLKGMFPGRVRIFIRTEANR